MDYHLKEEYDLILIDEAHKFRNHTSQMFQNLQLICKAGRSHYLAGDFKKRMVHTSSSTKRTLDIVMGIIAIKRKWLTCCMVTLRKVRNGT